MHVKKTGPNALTVILVAGLGVAPAVFADHASPWGEGWANMPNDIHNTRRDTLGSDNATFTDFVRYGNGADSVNRFLDDDLAARGTMGAAVPRGGGMGGGMGGRRR
jgi:hypothetical protein